MYRSKVTQSVFLSSSRKANKSISVQTPGGSYPQAYTFQDTLGCHLPLQRSLQLWHGGRRSFYSYESFTNGTNTPNHSECILIFNSARGASQRGPCFNSAEASRVDSVICIYIRGLGFDFKPVLHVMFYFRLVLIKYLFRFYQFRQDTDHKKI